MFINGMPIFCLMINLQIVPRAYFVGFFFISRSCNESQTSEALAEIPDSLVDNLPNIETLDDIETDDVTDAHLRTFYGTSHSADKLHDIAVAPRKNECIAPVVNGNGNSTAAGRPTLQDQGTEGRQTEDDIYGGSTDGVGGFYQ